MRKLSLFAVVLAFMSAAAFGQTAQITGDYVESRSADVYVAQCFANGEVNLVGDQAILAWHVRSGSWQGEKLDGLTVAAAVKARGTLGDPYENPYPAKATMLVDEQATPAQRAALLAFAKHMGGELLAKVVEVVPTTIDMQVMGEKHHGRAVMRAGEFAEIQTRPISEKDHTCGNETTFYPPLTKLSHSMPAVALTDQYQGPGLGVSWTLHDKRSAFVGSFSEPATGL